MSIYQAPGLITDAPTLKQLAIETMEAELPGWESHDAQIENAEFGAIAALMADQAGVLDLELTSVYRSLGPLAKTPPLEAVAATALCTFTLIDSLGHEVPAGVTVAIRDPNGELQGFTLLAPVEAKAEESTVVGTVTADEPGSAANHLEGLAELISVPPFVEAAVLATSGGGADAEDEENYLDRLTEAFALQRPGPVTAADAAVIARSIPGVYRACAINLLKPSTAEGGEGVEETNIEKCVTVAVRGFGADCTAEEIAAADALLQEEREVNFKYFVIKPHYMEVDVHVEAFAWGGFATAQVKAAIEEAVKVGLAPENFATDSTGKPQRWSGDSILRQGQLFAIAGGAVGVRWIPTVTFCKHGGALAAADLDLSEGKAIPSLPILRTLTVTVTPTS